MRLYSSILFALMAAVLPTAAMQKQFCTLAMVFVDSPDDCPIQKKDCCGKTESHKPADCMVTAKQLPNAEKFSHPDLPSMPSEWTWLPLPASVPKTAISLRKFSPETLRDPPDALRLFLIQRRLLI